MLEDYLEIDLDDFRKKMICKKLNSYSFGEASKAVAILRVLGIAPAYDWIGHRGEQFYPTVADVEMEEDWRFQCEDQESQ